MDNVISLASALSCAVIFVHAVCQAARVKHRASDISLWCRVLLVGGSLWSGVAGLMQQPPLPHAMLAAAVAILCGRVAWKVWRAGR